ncbi:acetyl/propionyl/methylcrotonyl-CoA carboxylase subunit alpha [Granulosicoccaceae sp. 1_MG-2023]|nr:acetyl/propionyl/methylcrotonyl-CoA carboxylase subunit alpha [Granulosicoccaceae sp. 1_MG-2023]
MSQKINKILIANRGEIACRVIKTARRLGIKTVAVYSDADEAALHVQMADEAVNIGPAASTESYLRIDKIIEATKQTGADAIHPGFGFLSENANFVEALKKENITFIGPDTLAIKAMGDKIESKKLALEAGVSCVPGHTEALSDADEALKIAGQIGCPVMLKASAGGGGKGMRVAWTMDEVKDGFISAQNEARSAFGDDRVFVEKFIEQPRHIEIQVLADQAGNCVYLHERECSIQRRHQKLIEEAPSPFLDEATRKAMGEQAVQLAKAVQYQSAGTVEFIVDKDRNFYFLEMNTRLQVEHPVTEYITGLDLVEQMIRVAEGQPLAFKQEEIKLEGWAIESRIYAEDPERNFMPSTGRLTKCQPPAESDSVRVDTGVIEGSEISMFYDPMIAKLVTYGKDRKSAIDAMMEALDSYVIRGIQQNIPFVAALLKHPEFRAGNLTTGFIDQYFSEGFDSVAQPPEQPALMIAVAVEQQFRDDAAYHDVRNKDALVMTDYVVKLNDEEHEVSVSGDLLNRKITIDGTAHTLTMEPSGNKIRLSGTFDGEAFTLQCDRAGINWKLTHRGCVGMAAVMRPRVAELARLMPVKVPPDMSKFLLSPMPGLLVKVSVNEGDIVKAGQELAVVEAMKMENVLTAEQDGVIASVKAAAGDSLAIDQIIIEFE